MDDILKAKGNIGRKRIFDVWQFIVHCCTIFHLRSGLGWSIQIPKGQYRDHLVGQLTRQFMAVEKRVKILRDKKKGRDKKENWDKSNWRLNLSLTSPFHTKLVWEIILREAIRIYGNIWRPFGGRECRLLRSSSVSAFPGFFMKTFPTFSWSQWFAFTAFFTFSLYSFK